MKTIDCYAFLQEVLPRLGLRWAGFRNVRRLVCKRIAKRLRELGLPDLSAYRRYLDHDNAEWHKLDAMCRIPISRFYRDREVFASLEHDVLPVLAAQAVAERRRELRCWSACCASGEEPYTVAVLWHLRIAPSFPSLALRILATDVDPKALHRWRVGWYSASSMKEVPGGLLCAGFERSGDEYCVRTDFRTPGRARQSSGSIPTAFMQAYSRPGFLRLTRGLSGLALPFFIAIQAAEVREVIRRLGNCRLRSRHFLEAYFACNALQFDDFVSVTHSFLLVAPTP